MRNAAVKRGTPGKGEPEMERLEAAMAKARAARQGARKLAMRRASDIQAVPPKPEPRDVARAALWEGLEEISIPRHVAEEKRLGALMGPEFAAPIDLLRTRVQRQLRAEGWKRLAITSPTTGCGKSTVSVNLALSLARQPDLHVALIDFDLRRPSIANLLEQTGRRYDMEGLLNGEVDFADQAVRYGPNLLLSLNRRSIPNSAELLLSPVVGDLLDEIQSEWRPDVMIFDTPPMLGNDDNLAFLGKVDCTLLIAAADTTTAAQLDACERDLSGLTTVLGTVLNKCRYQECDDSYGSGYY